jgi:capsular polysaccharide biosynthesis protein
MIRATSGVLRLRPQPPRGAIATTKEWAAQPHTDGRDYTEIYPAGTIERAPPRSIYAQPHWYFRQRRVCASVPVYLARIPQGRVIGRAGAVISGDDLILGDLSRDWFFETKEHPLLFKLKLPEPQKLAGKTVTLASPSGWNYYHWLLDVLPRVGILEKAGVDLQSVDGFIVNGGEAHYQTSTLDLLGIPKARRVLAGRGKQYQCENLVAPSPVGKQDHFPRWIVQFLRDKFLPKSPSGSYPSRIYVSRDRSKYRKFTNDAEVRAWLAKRGFAEVFTEEMSFPEQAALFASVNAVVAPHGAGLTNLVFCRSRTKVVEIFSPEYVNGCFWALANMADLDYFYALGAGRRPPENHDPQKVEQDITVNLEVLEATLALTLLI